MAHDLLLDTYLKQLLHEGWTLEFGHDPSTGSYTGVLRGPVPEPTNDAGELDPAIADQLKAAMGLTAGPRSAGNQPKRKRPEIRITARSYDAVIYQAHGRRIVYERTLAAIDAGELAEETRQEAPASPQADPETPKE